MHRRIAELRDNCEEFIWQPDDHILLVSSNDPDLPYVLKVLEQVEGHDEASLYLMVADPYVEAESYALTVAQRCVELYALVDQERLAREEPPLAPFPASMTAPRTPARERVVSAIEHLGARLPNAEEHRVVVVLLPIAIANWVDYAQFVAGLAGLPPAPARDESWSAYARLFLRNDLEHSLGAGLERRRAQGVLTLDVDMSTEALAADMARDAVDPAVPVAQRMQSVLQLANIDLSYKRFDEATKKFALLFDYYAKADAPIMQALCLQGVGDCLRMLGRHDQARQRYQQGLAIALAAKSPVPPLPGSEGGPAGTLHPNTPPVLLNLLLAAAATSMVLASYDDASSYYHDASKVAAKCMNAYAACDALQGQGDAQLAMGQLTEALAVWKDCETISEKYKYYDRLVSVLERIHRLYQEGQLRERAREAHAKLEGARRLQKQRAAR